MIAKYVIYWPSAASAMSSQISNGAESAAEWSHVADLRLAVFKMWKSLTGKSIQEVVNLIGSRLSLAAGWLAAGWLAAGWLAWSVGWLG